MSFLDNILETKRAEVATLQRARASFNTSKKRDFRSFKGALLQRSSLGVISEIKRKSPSKGVIQSEIDPIARAKVYERAGATAISVLTDRDFFGGSMEDLREVRKSVTIPVLRKDFIIDEIQIDEAYAAGADVVLLIAAALAPRRLSELSAYAQSLGLDVLLEVHGLHEVDAALAASPSVIGINNRNLHTFEVDLGITEQTIAALPKNQVVISESGIFGRDDAQRMVDAGAHAILVGELLMRHKDLANVAQCLSDLQVPFAPASVEVR
ncbi:indole-3-glycerol phosphate synthase TrpC [Alicyclobacillus dauci]|uniref:Indole-3-glycerol phosphate synthase n=1 Tax=Alicyclobacillus dauci TaxID=1475485 RepID=A0ABY6YYS0_9BACL|nr:indole-3-glycerol phosphate synthase TrpC [Alicyclobacillus dauci]WAH35126.1 indole-3-glycerol phosphate synthase TrpC [Alicyclobacillus dauci]